MKSLPKLLLSIFFCEAVGILGSIFTFSAIPTWYVTLNKPFFSPPNWLFGPVWTLLYMLMGISFYLIWQQTKNKAKKAVALKFFLAQLALNFIWTPVFFGLRAPLPALLIIMTLWFLIVMTMRKFYPLSKLAAYLLVPYLMWVGFATLLNGAIVVLN